LPFGYEVLGADRLDLDQPDRDERSERAFRVLFDIARPKSVRLRQSQFRQVNWLAT